MASIPLRIVQGVTVEVTYTIQDANGDPVDTTGASAEGKIRRELAPGADVLLDLAPYLTFPATGTLNLLLPAAVTDSWVETYTPGQWPYDIIVTLASGKAIRIVTGIAQGSYTATEVST